MISIVLGPLPKASGRALQCPPRSPDVTARQLKAGSVVVDHERQLRRAGSLQAVSLIMRFRASLVCASQPLYADGFARAAILLPSGPERFTRMG